MQILRRTWSPIWAVAGVIAGITGLMTLEIIEEPDMTPGQILMELAEPILIVLAVAGVVHLLGRMQRQHLEQLSLMRDLEVCARRRGAVAGRHARAAEGPVRPWTRSSIAGS